MKFEKNWPRGYRREVVQRFEWTGHGRQTHNDGQQVSTIANPESSSGELKIRHPMSR